MSIITLTTDYGLKDHFVASVKGRILSAMPQAQIVDISHCIDFYNIANASYVVSGAYPNFPKGSIHMVLVEAEMNDQTSFLLTKFNGHYFLTADNGTITLLATPEDETEIVKLHLPDFCTDTVSLFTYVSTQILKNSPFDDLGTPISYNECELLIELRHKVAEDENSIKGAIIYMDHYGNAVINITQDVINRVRVDYKLFIIECKYSIIIIHLIYIHFNVVNRSINEFECEMSYLFTDLFYLQLSIYNSDYKNVGNA